MRIVGAVGGALVIALEYLVNRRRARKARKRAKQSSHLIEWIKSFLWAAGMVLLINQYLLQAYQIPSGSMRTALIEGDRVFVGKFVFGPELLPGVGKIRGVRQSRYGEVVIFENPTYISRGPLFAIVQRVLYMLTLSLVDLERNVQGEHQIQLLIKRHIGTDNQQIRLERGEFYFTAFGGDQWLTEREYMQRHGRAYAPQRLIDPALYDYAERAAVAVQRNEAGHLLTQEENDAIDIVSAQPFIDRYHFEHVRSYHQLVAQPHELFRLYREQRRRNGWYIPAGYFLPLGDNRDNSRDGRYYGIVATTEVLGKARLRYWPFGRIGIIR